MPHPYQQHRTTVAILGTNTAVNSALSLLLNGAGYDTRRVERDLPGLSNGLLEGVAVLLLAPGLGDGSREAVLTTVSDNPIVGHIPVLTLSSAIGEAPGDESGQEVVAWPSPVEELVRRIEAVLVPPTGEED